jgi:toxin HigB-1
MWSRAFSTEDWSDSFSTGTNAASRDNTRNKIADILDRLDASVSVQDMSVPGSGLHRLKGTLKNHWSVRVSGNWRITFRFEDGNAYVVDYQDYH